MTIWERVKNALTGLGVPISANLHIEASGAELPDLFLVYFLVSSPPEQSADDRETLRSYRMQVSAYSRSGLISLPDIDGAMVAAGFSRGPQRELPFNEQTRHFGLALEYIYLEESDVV